METLAYPTLIQVGRVIPNPLRLAPTTSNRRVKDNAPYRP
jgi:hypothetical protein